MVESIETVVIGAGHAGLSTSYYLKQQGKEHIILDKAAQPANAWRNERWDSFTFVSPNWTFQLPGGAYDGPEPDGFMTKTELVEHFDRYVDENQLPVRCSTRVLSVRSLDDGAYQVHTESSDILARNVVVANGWFQSSRRPGFAAKLPASIRQLHTNQYLNPESLPPGAVVVVGAGQSGAQIAEELNQHGRRVFLCTGFAPHAPRRYRGKDTFRWLVDSGFADQTYEQLSVMGHTFVAPLFSGKDGGHALNLHKFYREGVILLGHARDLVDGKLILAPDLKENLGKSDFAQKNILKRFDEYISRAGVDAPMEEFPEQTDGYQAPIRTELDLEQEGVGTVIWACGYSYDSSIFQFPVTNANGLPDAPRGVSRQYPGLYFVGFPFLPGLKSGFVAGVAHSAAYVVEDILERRGFSSGPRPAPDLAQ